MIYYLIISVFVLCSAITSGSIVMTSRLKQTYKSEFFSPLIFFLVFYFTFGYYGIWGKIIVELLLISVANHELILRIAEVMGFLGTPFLLVASLMYVKYARDLSGRKTGNLFILTYLFINLIIIGILGYAGFSNPGLELNVLIRYYFIALSSLFSILGAYYFLVPGGKRSSFRYHDLSSLAIITIALVFVQNTVLLAHDAHFLIPFLFIITFFLTGSLSPVYLKYKADLSGLIPADEISPSFDHFCDLYKISPREKEIIHEICKGLSNQEIADRLFISLQTVKDHTHRIYFKTDCSSRAQLIRKVNDIS